MSQATPYAGKTSYKSETGTQTDPASAGPQPGQRILYPKPYQSAPDKASSGFDYHAFLLDYNSKHSTASLVGYEAEKLAEALNEVCEARGCMHTADTTGVPTQSYLYFKPANAGGRARARHPIDHTEVWSPSLSHITIVRIPPKPWKELAPTTNGQHGAAPAADDPVPPEVAALFGQTLQSGDQGEKGSHLTLRSEANVLSANNAQQDANQVSMTRGIPVAPDVVRQNHFAKGRYTIPLNRDASNYLAGASATEATYRKASYAFWHEYEDTSKNRRKTPPGWTEDRLNTAWAQFFTDLNEDIMYLMETWALVLERANVIR